MPGLVLVSKNECNRSRAYLARIRERITVLESVSYSSVVPCTSVEQSIAPIFQQIDGPAKSRRYRVLEVGRITDALRCGSACSHLLLRPTDRLLPFR